MLPLHAAVGDMEAWVRRRRVEFWWWRFNRAADRLGLTKLQRYQFLREMLERAGELDAFRDRLRSEVR